MSSNDSDQPLRRDTMSGSQMRWNGGLLCCAFFNNQLHCLLGTEYRAIRTAYDSYGNTRQKKRRRRASSGDPEAQDQTMVLQLSIPGGRHENGETALDTVVREFWEETARVVDRDAVRAALINNGKGFDFSRSRYHLAVLVCRDERSPCWDVVARFNKRTAEHGYPSDCSVQLYWVPWSDIWRSGDANSSGGAHCISSVTTTQLSDSSGWLPAPLSYWTRHTLLEDSRVRDYIARLDHNLRFEKRHQQQYCHFSQKNNGAQNQ